MAEFLIYEQAGAVVTLTLNSPDTRNALSHPEQYQQIIEACERINLDTSVGAVILTGAGSCFCAGGNVKDMKEQSGMFSGDPLAIADKYRHGIQKIPLALYNLEAPTIAAVNGPAIGAGCDLTLMCDIRIASEKAKFAESFVQLGLIPGDGGAWLLQRAVGLSTAYEIFPRPHLLLKPSYFYPETMIAHYRVPLLCQTQRSKRPLLYESFSMKNSLEMSLLIIDKHMFLLLS